MTAALTPVPNEAQLVINKLQEGMLERFVAGATQHGEDEGLDAELGDLEDMVKAMWPLMTRQQYQQLFASNRVSNLVEVMHDDDQGLLSFDDESEVDADEWKSACMLFDFDPKPAYAREVVVDVVNAFRMVNPFMAKMAAALHKRQKKNGGPALNDAASADLSAGMLGRFLALAERHGEGDDPEHEAGDMQDMLYAMWALLLPAQRAEFLSNADVLDAMETACCSIELLTEDGLDYLGDDEWESACTAAQLDPTLEYEDDAKFVIVNEYRFAAEDEPDEQQQRMSADAVQR